MYNFDFVLKRLDSRTWDLLSTKGVVVYRIENCVSKEAALAAATAWASSWHSARVRLADE